MGVDVLHRLAAFGPLGRAFGGGFTPNAPLVPAAAIGFPDPSPLELPALGPADSGLEILDEDDDDSGWRNLIKARASRGDDILIELD